MTPDSLRVTFVETRNALRPWPYGRFEGRRWRIVYLPSDVEARLTNSFNFLVFLSFSDGVPEQVWQD